MEVVNFRRPAPAAAAPPPAGPVPIRMPLTPGIQRRLTDDERQSLEQLGWKDGDAIPGNLAEQLAALRARDAAGLQADMDALQATPDLAFDERKATPIESLSPAARGELQAQLASMVAMAKTIGESQTQGPAPPGVAEAIAMAATRPASPPQQPRPIPAATPQPVPAPSPTGLASAPTHCPHCRWDLSRDDVPEPTDDDKRQYLTAQLTGARFTREATVLGGHVRVVFRELKAAETSALFIQANRDTPADVDQGAYFATVMSYQMIAGMESVVLGGRRTFPIPEVLSVPGDRPFPELMAWVKEKVLPSESLWAIAYSEHARFRRLLERLIVNATDPDFYRGIPGPA